MMKIETIVLFVAALFLTKSGLSQDSVFLEKCEVISIDTVSSFSGYLSIKVASSKGKLLLLSEIKDQENGQKLIKVNGQYDFFLKQLDSVLVFVHDTSWFFVFPGIRGGRGGTLYYDDDESLKFEDFNFKPYKALNLKGLMYESTVNRKNE